MSDVKEAAERLRQLNRDRLNQCFGGPDADTSGVDEARDTLAQQYLAEHPPGDELPIDEEWLLSTGPFYESGRYGSDCHILIADIAGSMDDSLCWNLETRKAELWIGSRYIVIPANTRGDLRRLCSALGIELEEPPKEGVVGNG